MKMLEEIEKKVLEFETIGIKPTAILLSKKSRNRLFAETMELRKFMAHGIPDMILELKILYPIEEDDASDGWMLLTDKIIDTLVN